MKITNDTKLKVGDIVDRRTILAILEPVYFLSCKDDSKKARLNFHREELNDMELSVKEWSPNDLKEGDKYWYFDTICNGVQISSKEYLNSVADKFYIDLGNCYQTREAAEEVYKKIMES